MDHEGTYPNLLSPIRLAHLTLPNRVMMGSMHTGLEEAPRGPERLGAFYAERAAGGSALIVTGGIGVSETGALALGARKITTEAEAEQLRVIAERVHEAGGRILLQLIHAGRYAYSPKSAAPSAIQAPINPFKPRAMSTEEVEQTIADFARAAALAKLAGFDGVEIMGSEGYLINQFLAPHTNHRDDRWGGSFENRMRFPVSIVEQVRAAVGDDFIVMYRESMLDLLEDGSTGDEVIRLAKGVEAAGATAINTGIGWHEARIPTIATMVPRAAFAWATERVKRAVGIPVVASNRINTPELGEQLIAAGQCDMISMARPMLADSHFVAKAAEGRAREINVCIACNQACLDHTFNGKMATCLVNPRACREDDPAYRIQPTDSPLRIAVVGAGPAGLAYAEVAARRGHHVTLFEAEEQIGGQFNMAQRVPGKEEYAQTVRYFATQLERYRVTVQVGRRVQAQELIGGAFDRVVLATGVTPRRPDIPGIDHPKVVSYAEVLLGRKEVGRRAALIGAGGIGIDTAQFLAHNPSTPSPGLHAHAFNEEWGISEDPDRRGGVADMRPRPSPSPRTLFLCQRSNKKIGRNLGKTTAWAHRKTLALKGVEVISEAQYRRIDDTGLHLVVGNEPRVLAVDNIVVCAGQESERTLQAPLTKAGIPVDLIGGADIAAELDAKRAIDQGFRLAAAV